MSDDHFHPEDPTTTRAHDLQEKRWFPHTLRLSDLEKFIAEVKTSTKDGEDPRIVLVEKGGGSYGLDREAAFIGYTTRAKVLEREAARQINEHGGDEQVIAHVQFEQEAQLEATGEVIYLLAAYAFDYAPDSIFEE
jgi:hypothetical protein